MHEKPHIWNKVSVELNAEQVSSLEAQLRKQKELQRAAEDRIAQQDDQLSRAEEIIHTLKADTERLAKTHKQELAQLKESEETHKEEARVLQLRYAVLRDNRDAISDGHKRDSNRRKRFMKSVEVCSIKPPEEYKRDVMRYHKKWKTFCKTDDDAFDEEIRKGDRFISESAHLFPTPRAHRRTQRAPVTTILSPLSKNKVNTPCVFSTPTKTKLSAAHRSPVRRTHAQCSPSKTTPAKRKHSTSENDAALVSDSSETQPDSQMPSQFFSDTPIHFTPSKRARRFDTPASAPAPMVAKSSQMGDTCANFHRTSASSTTSPAIAKAAARITRHFGKQAGTSPIKRRGRYSKASTFSREDNESDYEINPVANAGVHHPFEEVVRGKASRRTLNAADCEECRDYYEAVGPMPPRLQAPLWRTPPRRQQHTHHRAIATHALSEDNVLDGFNAHQIAMSRGSPSHVNAHRQEISRHRAQWAPPRTPPGYWDIGFPDTQAAAAINERAEEMRREKANAVRIEAGKSGGKFRKKGR